MSFLRCVYHRNRFLKSVYVELHVCQPVAVSSSSSASSSPSPPVVSFCTSTSSSSSSSGSNNHHHIVSSTQTSNSSNARDRLCVQIRPTSVANLISGHLPYLHFNRLTMSVCEASSKKASNQSSNNTRNNDNAGELQRSPVLQPNAFLSEGNYRWSRGGAAGGGGAGTSDQHRYQQSQQQQQNEQQHQQQTRCDFEWLSIRLLEKITFIVSISPPTSVYIISCHGYCLIDVSSRVKCALLCVVLLILVNSFLLSCDLLSLTCDSV